MNIRGLAQASMATPQSTPLFTYEPLPDASTHIRLLQVLDVCEDSKEEIQVQVQLTVWSRADAPPYHAISYTWGDEDGDASVVLINGQLMHVRRNCEYVLRQAKWYDDGDGPLLRCYRRMMGRRKKRGYFWCDALCIDQANIEEKSFQVAKMGSIYHSAQGVLACVGECGGGSEVLFSVLRDSKTAILLRAMAALEASQAVKASKKHEDGLIRIGINVPAQRRGTIHTLLLSACLAMWARTWPKKAAWSQVTEALLLLAKRDYFRRVWVYQELFLGSDIIVCCGRDVAPLRVLYGLLQVVYGNSKRARRYGLASLDRNQNLKGLGQCEDMVEAGSVAGLGMKYFWEALYTVSLLDCTDARDRVYGVLSLVAWGSQETPIFPDYTRDAFELGVEVLLRLGSFHRLIVMRSLGLLSSVSEGLQNARQRRRRSTTTPLDYNAHAAGIPHSVPDKTNLMTNSFGLNVCEVGGQLFLHSPSTLAIEVRFFKWPEYCERRDSIESQRNEGTAITVIVAFDTEPGDWCIFYRSECFTRGWLVLVARCVDEIQETIVKSNRSHRFMIVGKGLALAESVHNSPTDGSTQSKLEEAFVDCLRQGGIPFDVYCGAEDALCLESSFMPIATSDHSALCDGFLSGYFDMRVCGQPGSSYAFDIYYQGREWPA